MAKFMFSEIARLCPTYTEAKKFAQSMRKSTNEHVKYYIEGHTHCDSMGNPLESEWCVEVWRHHNSGKVNKFIDLWF